MNNKNSRMTEADLKYFNMQTVAIMYDHAKKAAVEVEWLMTFVDELKQGEPPLMAACIASREWDC